MKEKESPLFWYLKEVVSEEVLFRLCILGLIHFYVGFSFWFSIVLSSVVYGVIHFILFKWQMVLVSTLFGVLLGWLYLQSVYVFLITYEGVVVGLLVVVLVHLFGGYLCDLLGFTMKWMRYE